jgi:hypothetical protein
MAKTIVFRIRVFPSFQRISSVSFALTPRER